MITSRKWPERRECKKNSAIKTSKETVIDQEEILKTWEGCLGNLYNDIRGKQPEVGAIQGPPITKEKVKSAIRGMKKATSSWWRWNLHWNDRGICVCCRETDQFGKWDFWCRIHTAENKRIRLYCHTIKGRSHRMWKTSLSINNEPAKVTNALHNQKEDKPEGW